MVESQCVLVKRWSNVPNLLSSMNNASQKNKRGTGDRDLVKDHGSLYGTDVEGRVSDAQQT